MSEPDKNGAIPVSTSQENTYYDLRNLVADKYADAKPGVLSATLDGHPVAVVVALPYDINHDNIKDREFDVHPVAILVDDELLQHLGERLRPPEGFVHEHRGGNAEAS